MEIFMIKKFNRKENEKKKKETSDDNGMRTIYN